MPLLISVVIPAYNVEKFIVKAIESALKQAEVLEVIVVNDGSTDRTLSIVQELQINEARIKIFQHNEGKNKGRSASRNLGIKNSKAPFIAFLDADDFYLDHRFECDKQILEADPQIEGVYNAVGFHYYRQASQHETDQNKLNTLREKLEPEQLFDALITSHYGYLHLNGITIKKTILEAIGYFNESLVVAEDTDLLLKMALKAKLLPGVLDHAMALRGVHETNVFNNENLYKIYNIKLYESVLIWSFKNEIDFKKIDTILHWLWVFVYRQKNSLTKDSILWVKLFFPNPKILFSILTIKYFPIVRRRKELFPFLYQN